MVRKRSRKYQSDDNDSDSDVEFGAEPRSKPAPKKYSLRERKRAPLFTTEDYDYYGLDEDVGAQKQSSDDEDFEVEADVNGARAYFEPDPDVDPQNAEGLIDFEDIIRADIVVNRNKIDYDNIIQKTEIKLGQPKKRGRKPKKRPVEIVQGTGLVCEPEISSFEPLAETKIEENETSGEKLETEGNPEGLPNGDVLESGDLLKNNDTSIKIENKDSSAEIITKAPSKEDLREDKIEEEDDDVIVLGELKQEVIVLDD